LEFFHFSLLEKMLKILPYAFQKYLKFLIYLTNLQN
jgi:hypothetical protein